MTEIAEHAKGLPSTKQNTLTLLAGIFDHLGIMGPVTVVAWGLSPSLVGLAQKTISQTRVPRVSFQRSSFVIAYLVCVTFGGSSGDLFCHGRYRKSLGREIGET